MATANPNDLRSTIRRFLSHSATDHVVAGLIVISCILLLFEATWPQNTYLHAAGFVLLAIFLVELILRFIVSRSHAAFIRNYWIDALSLIPLILPGYGIFRVLRLLRLFRLGPLLIHGNRHFGRVFRQTARQQITIASIVLVVVLGVTLALTEIEASDNFRDVYGTFYYSLLSLIAAEPEWPHPAQTTLGKFFTLVLLGGGFTVFAVFTGTVAALVAERLEKGSRTGIMDLEELHDHIIVCGWNRSGRVLLEEIHSNPPMRNTPILVIAETRPEFSESIEMNPHIMFIAGDYTTVGILQRARVEKAKTAILLADRSVPSRSDQDRDARTVLAALIIEKLHPGIFTCAELLSRDNEVHLRLAGIEEVVIGDEYSATILATSSRVHGVTQIADEIFSLKVGNQIYKREIRNDWDGMKFIDLQAKIKSSFDALVIAVENAPQNHHDVNTPYRRTLTNPPADHTVRSGDLLIVLAHSEPTW